MDFEKVLCCDRGNDNALTAAILANGNRRDDSGMWAANSMNSWMNNPFAYMMMMAWMRNFNNENGNAQGIETQAQLNAIRTQLQDNQNSGLVMGAIQGNKFDLSQLSQNLNVDFNTLQRAVCDVQSAIQQVAGMTGFSAERVINAVNLGDCRVIEALKDCCCQNKELVQRMGYENQLGQKDIQFTTQKGFCDLGYKFQSGMDFLNRSVERGFAAEAYERQAQTCEIIKNQDANTQRIVDTLKDHWDNEKSLQIQDLKFQLSQKEQNEKLISAYYGSRNNCNCGNNCNGGF